MTSSSGGYLQPAPAPAPLEGAGLNDLLQAWVVGVTGLPDDMVRISFAPEPPVIPTAGDAWVALSRGERGADPFPYVRHNPNGDGSSTLQRQEALHLLCSFYDLGTDGLADEYAALMRDNIFLQQNNEPLLAGGIKVAHAGELTTLPVLVKQRWLYRVDLPVVLNRQVDRDYQVQSVLSIDGRLYTDDGQAPRVLRPTQP